jgi:electron-transferring-flavoprotein dehydrogenase
MHNTGFYVVSLSRLTRWLAEIAEELGVNLFPGFAGKEVLFGADDRTIVGIRTGDKGLGKDREPKGNFEPGIDLMAKVTLFGEGAQGSLFREAADRLDLFSGKMPQVFETGIKEVIQLPEKNYFSTSKGNDIHTLGYPLGLNPVGGGFIYEMKENRASVGFLVGLGYEDPGFDLYDLFIRFKRHPFVAKVLEGGKVLEQGARTVSTGGYYTIPRLSADGGMFIGGSAGMQNPPALKGIHVSMKSGMLAAEAAFEAVQKGDYTRETLDLYPGLFERSWLKTEIYEGRNFSQALSRKIPMKFIHLGAQYVTGGRGITDRMEIEPDAGTLRPVSGDGASAGAESEDRKFDGVLYVDKLTGVYLSKTMHREDEPCHLIVHDPKLCVTRCFETYRSPCTRFCPGNVYEIETDEKTSDRRLKLNPSNCLHCKTCEIKDPFENITWTCPEGGEGPGYGRM